MHQAATSLWLKACEVDPSNEKAFDLAFAKWLKIKFESSKHRQHFAAFSAQLDYSSWDYKNPILFYARCMGSSFFDKFLVHLADPESATAKSASDFTDFVYGEGCWKPSTFQTHLEKIRDCSVFPFKLILPERAYTEEEFKVLLELISIASEKGIPCIDLGGSHCSESQITKILDLFQQKPLKRLPAILGIQTQNPEEASLLAALIAVNDSWFAS